MEEFFINGNGICWGSEEDLEINKKQVELCEKWIKEFVKERKTINKDFSSYKLKHMVEEHFNQYISNGAFIQASKNLGFKIKPCGNINAYFNMRILKEDYSKELKKIAKGFSEPTEIIKRESGK
jgi:hypothetical protein